MVRVRAEADVGLVLLRRTLQRALQLLFVLAVLALAERLDDVELSVAAVEGKKRRGRQKGNSAVVS